MTDDDIRAFGPPNTAPGRPPGASPAHRAPRVGRWLLAGALLFLLLATAVGALVWVLMAEAAHEGLNVVVNGEPWLADGLSGQHAVLGLLGAGLAVLTVMLVVGSVVTLVVPLSLLVALLAAALGLGLALLAVVAVAGVLLSPLWLALLLLWLALRRKSAPAATMAK